MVLTGLSLNSPMALELWFNGTGTEEI